MFAIDVSTEFCASHQLRLPQGGLEPLHGHNWRVEVRVGASELDALETVMDFHKLQEAVNSVVAEWNNRHLNDIVPFNLTCNPSAERVAERIAELLRGRLPTGVRLMRVRISEAPSCRAMYMPE